MKALLQFLLKSKSYFALDTCQMATTATPLGPVSLQKGKMMEPTRGSSRYETPRHQINNQFLGRSFRHPWLLVPGNMDRYTSWWRQKIYIAS